MTNNSNENTNERVLYGFWVSPFMALVAHFLKEAELEFRYERVSPYLGDTQTDEHKARSSFAKVPSLEDNNGLVISESQAICRYLARAYPQAQKFYPCHSVNNDDLQKCAQIDEKNDFITFSISGPFFNCIVVGAYYPQAFKIKTEKESAIFSMWSVFLVKGALNRLLQGSAMQPFLLGSEPTLPDFHVFQILEVSKTFANIFDMPMIDLVAGNEALQAFYDAMLERPATQEVLAAQAAEIPLTKKEIFEDFGEAYKTMLQRGKRPLKAMFGHDV